MGATEIRSFSKKAGDSGDKGLGPARSQNRQRSFAALLPVTDQHRNNAEAMVSMKVRKKNRIDLGVQVIGPKALGDLITKAEKDRRRFRPLKQIGSVTKPRIKGLT